MSDKLTRVDPLDHSSLNYILDENGNPVPEPDIVKFAAWFEDPKNRRVMETDLGLRGRVSTVFLGTDHGYGSYRPVLWETMVFRGWFQGEQFRYTSKQTAVKGHKAIAKRCSKWRYLFLHVIKSAYSAFKEIVQWLAGK